MGDMNGQISKPTTKEAYVYQVLRSAILNCELRPRQKLVIDHLSQELAVSPIPIRGALQRLQAEGLVDIRPHAGAAVAPLHLEHIGEIFTLLTALEQTAVRLAAPQMDEEKLGPLTALVEEMETAANQSDPQRWSALNADFHLALAQLSGMPLLVEFTRRTLENWLRLSRCTFSQVGILRLRQAQAEHRQMVALLARGDTVGLVELVDRHNQSAHEAYQDLAQAGALAGRER